MVARSNRLRSRFPRTSRTQNRCGTLCSETMSAEKTRSWAWTRSKPMAAICRCANQAKLTVVRYLGKAMTGTL